MRHQRDRGENNRLRLIFAIVTIALAASAAVGDVAAGSQPGRISGVTQISFGCPGPVREGTPSCKRWTRFPHGRFSISQLTNDNTTIVGTRQIITSGNRGQFTIALPSGRYLLKPLPQRNTRGGTPIHLEVRPPITSWALVRFTGYPRML